MPAVRVTSGIATAASASRNRIRAMAAIRPKERDAAAWSTVDWRGDGRPGRKCGVASRGSLRLVELVAHTRQRRAASARTSGLTRFESPRARCHRAARRGRQRRAPGTARAALSAPVELRHRNAGPRASRSGRASRRPVQVGCQRIAARSHPSPQATTGDLARGRGTAPSTGGGRANFDLIASLRARFRSQPRPTH